MPNREAPRIGRHMAVVEDEGEYYVMTMRDADRYARPHPETVFIVYQANPPVRSASCPQRTFEASRSGKLVSDAHILVREPMDAGLDIGRRLCVEYTRDEVLAQIHDAKEQGDPIGPYQLGDDANLITDFLKSYGVAIDSDGGVVDLYETPDSDRL